MAKPEPCSRRARHHLFNTQHNSLIRHPLPLLPPPPTTTTTTLPHTQHPPPKKTTPTDPNLLDTLESYDGSPAFLQSLQLDKEGLTKAIIGTMGDIDAYQLPDAKGYAAFSR